MSVTMTTDDATATVELVVDGRVTRDDWDTIVPQFADFMEQHGKIRLLEVIDTLDGFDPALIWKGIKFDFQAIPHITHCAVVSDSAWMSPLAKAVGAVTPMQVRFFPRDRLEAARAWIAHP